MTSSSRKLLSCVILDLDGTLLNTGGFMSLFFVEIFYMNVIIIIKFCNDYLSGATLPFYITWFFTDACLLYT